MGSDSPDVSRKIAELRASIKAAGYSDSTKEALLRFQRAKLAYMRDTELRTEPDGSVYTLIPDPLCQEYEEGKAALLFVEEMEISDLAKLANQTSGDLDCSEQTAERIAEICKERQQADDDLIQICLKIAFQEGDTQ